MAIVAELRGVVDAIGGNFDAASTDCALRVRRRVTRTPCLGAQHGGCWLPRRQAPLHGDTHAIYSASAVPVPARATREVSVYMEAV